MIGELSNHLWQSTVFAACAAVLAAALRKNGAHIRHLVWLSASLKFLVPFSLLMSLGSQWAWTRPDAAGADAAAFDTVSIVMDQVTQPFTPALPPAPLPAPGVDWTPILIGGVWALGFAAILLIRLRGWGRIRAAVRASVPATINGVAIPPHLRVRASAGLLEPGVVGLWRPILLVPAGLETRLTSSQLEAVFAHELCHVRRRDNVTAAVHMAVEAVFWFHPIVWWIGARMVDERERACDEHVLRVLGKPEAYAEGILNVCKLYVESPLTCVSGVTGSNLKRRIESIMVNRIGMRLNFARKIAITLAAVLALAAPAPGGARRGGAGGWTAQTTPGRVYWDCATLATLIDQAYADIDHPLLHIVGDSRPPNLNSYGPVHPKRVRGGPSWVEKDMFTVEAKAPVELTAAGLAGATGRNLATLPRGMSLALRAALEDRFKVKVRRVTEQQDMYGMVVADGGLNKTKVTTPVAGDCVSKEKYFELIASMPPARTLAEAEAQPRICGQQFSMLSGTDFSSATLSQLAGRMSEVMDRYVIDQTGIDAKLNFKMTSGPGDTSEQRQMAGLAALGLKLRSIKAPAEYLFIDRAEQPTPNEAFAAPSTIAKEPAAVDSAAQSAASKFDVASVKLCEPEQDAAGGRSGGGGPGFSPGRAYLGCYPVKSLIDLAYISLRRATRADAVNEPVDSFTNWPQMQGREEQQIRGGPSWVTSDKYTIEATAAALDPKDRRNFDRGAVLGLMLRALLEDRFKLKLHEATEEAPMWALVVAKGGLKLKPMVEGSCTTDWSGPPITVSMAQERGVKPNCGTMISRQHGSNWRSEYAGQNLGAVAALLSSELGVKVLDKTGVADKFTFMWEFGPDENTPGAAASIARVAPGGPPPTAPTIFTALKEQLGLELVKTKGQRGFLVIDHVERPTPNLPTAIQGSGR